MNQRDVGNVGIKYRPRNNRSATLGLGDELKTLLVHLLDNAFVPAIGFDQTIENEDRKKNCQNGYEGFEKPHDPLTCGDFGTKSKKGPAAFNPDSAVGIDRDARHNPSAPKSMGFWLGVDIAQRCMEGRFITILTTCESAK